MAIKKILKPKVAIVMGSDSDLPKLQGASDILTELGVPHEVQVVSAHRTPQKMSRFATTAARRGIEVIIAGAGGAAHLPGMIAAMTDRPVIGVPVTVGQLKGLDALLSIVQMPTGVPVATVAIENSANAGLLAARILALHDSGLAKRLGRYRQKQRSKVVRANRQLNKKP